MIRYTQGNLLTADAEALVNTVNEVGVMGKGIALMFKEAFPESARAYQEASKAGDVRVGHVLVTRNPELVGPRWIIHFPTKKHWRHPSKLEWIREGLRDLQRVIGEHQIRSIAVPPLGCGNGGLDWAQVRREIEAALGRLPDVAVTVYEPSATYQNAPKRTGVEELTPARALIAELVRRYLVLGHDCTNIEIHKLAWFLSRQIAVSGLPDPLELDWTADRYGPYADRLRHLLNNLDGSYLHCEKRLSDAKPYDHIWFDDSRRAELAAYLAGPEAGVYLPALERTAELIDGFESPLGMELLATVDWLLTEQGVAAEVEAVRAGLGQWPGGEAAGRRKLGLFDTRLLGLALERLTAGAAA
ncbi:MAG: macro domain-containing protein [Gemmatimonadetes bacterium]|nr:macro domain-containing protein [Gemmatimonadota bacterium]